MNTALANFSTDLRRISYWIIEEDFEMANQFLNFCKKKYSNIPKKIGCYDDIWQEIEKIENTIADKEKASERALTASIILLDQALLEKND
jgi:hypothetical protein